MHAFTLLERKGLHTVQTRGPFHQNLHDAIYHVTEAHFRACWKVVGKVEKLEDLHNRTPVELYSLARQIVEELASSTTVEAIGSQPGDEQDETFRHSILWNWDSLRYIDLSEAILTGDVGILEDTLPHLAFRFSGGGNSKYTLEILELLQGLHHDWPPEIWFVVLRRLDVFTDHPM